MQCVYALLEKGSLKAKAYQELLGLEFIDGVLTTHACKDLEKELARLIHQLLAAPNIKFQDYDPAQKACLETSLHEEQLLAIKASLKTSFFILTGGPGTGKTHTVLNLIKAHSPKKRCFMLAPTGKAVMQMKERLLKNAFSYENLKNAAEIELEVLTLHKALGITSDKKEPIPLEADLVIVDEASMVDAATMKALFTALSNKTKLILIGDPNQLPSVESGSIFSDLVSVVRKKEPEKIAHLEQCHRVESLELLEFAKAVALGDVTAIEKVFSKEEEKEGSKAALEVLEGLDPALFSLRFFDRDFKNSEEAYTAFKAFRMLCPLRKGKGSDFINQEIFSHLRKMKKAFYIPIIITRSKGSFINGQMGALYLEKDRSLDESCAYFEDALGALQEYRAYDLPAYDLAFCLSVHKSQGSEFDEVLLFMPKGSEAFGVKALYTAATRAKKKLFLSGEKKIYIEAAGRKGERVSLLSQFLELE